MKINDLPLRELFDKLREAGFVLGIDEYQLLLQSLMAGFGLSDRQSLARLCKTLWVKSTKEVETFDYYFARIMSQPILDETVTLERPVEEKPKVTPTPDPETKPTKPSSSSSPSPSPSTNPAPNRPSEGDRPVTQSPGLSSAAADAKAVPKTVLKINDEVQGAKTRREEIDPNPSNRFLLFSDYLPVTAREMKQTWRYLRRPLREGPPIELDVEATVRQIARQGFLLNPVLVPQRVNRVELILLLDLDGSMVAFHSLGNRIKETAIGGGRLGRAGVYYFHNCPVDYLYRDPGYLQPLSFEQVLSKLSSNHSSVLIFSDAGAARGGYSEERIELTEIFLRQFQQRLRYIAWLNPVPRSRWSKTTAGEIAKLIPMFECDRQGLQNAVKMLRGNRLGGV